MIDKSLKIIGSNWLWNITLPDIAHARFVQRPSHGLFQFCNGPIILCVRCRLSNMFHCCVHVLWMRFAKMIQNRDNLIYLKLPKYYNVTCFFFNKNHQIEKFWLLSECCREKCGIFEVLHETEPWEMMIDVTYFTFIISNRIPFFLTFSFVLQSLTLRFSNIHEFVSHNTYTFTNSMVNNDYLGLRLQHFNRFLLLLLLLLNLFCFFCCFQFFISRLVNYGCEKSKHIWSEDDLWISIE